MAEYWGERWELCALLMGTDKGVAAIKAAWRLSQQLSKIDDHMTTSKQGLEEIHVNHVYSSLNHQ